MEEIRPNLDELLAQAIRLEMTGQDYFLAKAKVAASPLTKKVFLSLAKDEERHLRKVEAVYHAVKTIGKWPIHERLTTRTTDLKKIFEQTSKESPKLQEKTTDYEALKQAITLEKESITFYSDLQSRAQYEDERIFLEKLIAEENEHYRLISDTIYYLFSTAAFFSQEEKNIYE